ncbi:MAG TPA: type II CAAX endopeptidase family protein [Chitinophagaceae bacterium]|nr:type II CAAX endopeptidase family protein [Chitinophagaceae bacterium]
MNKGKPLIEQGWLRVTAFFICFIVFQVIATLLIGLWKMLADNTSAVNVITITIIFNFCTSLVLVFLCRRLIDKDTVYSLGLNFLSYKLNGLLGLLMGIAGLGVGTFLLIAFKNLKFTGWFFDWGNIGWAFVLMLLVAIAEEIMFRGYILNNLMRSLNKYTALVISSLIFALAHSTNPEFNLLAFVNVFLAGIFLGIDYIHTKNLFYAVVLHFTWNFFQGPVLGFEVSGIEFPSIFQIQLSGNELITGGKFGFEGSLPATVVLILSIILLFISFRIKTRATTAKPVN